MEGEVEEATDLYGRKNDKVERALVRVVRGGWGGGGGVLSCGTCDANIWSREPLVAGGFIQISSEATLSTHLPAEPVEEGIWRHGQFFFFHFLILERESLNYLHVPTSYFLYSNS